MQNRKQKWLALASSLRPPCERQQKTAHQKTNFESIFVLLGPYEIPPCNFVFRLGIMRIILRGLTFFPIFFRGGCDPASGPIVLSSRCWRGELSTRNTGWQSTLACNFKTKHKAGTGPVLMNTGMPIRPESGDYVRPTESNCFNSGFGMGS